MLQRLRSQLPGQRLRGCEGWRSRKVCSTRWRRRPIIRTRPRLLRWMILRWPVASCWQVDRGCLRRGRGGAYSQRTRSTLRSCARLCALLRCCVLPRDGAGNLRALRPAAARGRGGNECRGGGRSIIDFHRHCWRGAGRSESVPPAVSTAAPQGIRCRTRLPPEDVRTARVACVRCHAALLTRRRRRWRVACGGGGGLT